MTQASSSTTGSDKKDSGKNLIKLLRGTAAFFICVLLLLAAQRLLVPKYYDDIVEGAFIAEYYREQDKSFDVIFVGDCEVYENFSPVKLWNEYGINSYIRGSAEQYIFQSYYLIEDTIRYHKPRAVVFNVQSLQFNEAQSESYNRMSLEGLRWSPVKVRSILASMKEGEHFIEYVFPILRYHSRWDELTASDLKYFNSHRRVSHNGYYMRTDIRPVDYVPEGRILPDYTFGDNAVSYLERMQELCRKEGIELIFIKAPSVYPVWYPEYDEQVVRFAVERGIRYINFLDEDILTECGLDYSTDTYDGGLHMNLYGAEKLSVYLGDILREDYGIPDRRAENGLASIWEKKTAEYEDEIEMQAMEYGMDEEYVRNLRSF